MTEFPRRYTTEQLQKPGKGSTKQARAAKSSARERNEERQKDEAKERDHHVCQRPNCPECGNRHKGGIYKLHGAHWKAKGMGGDPTGVRSERKHFITLCGPSHVLQETHVLEVVPVSLVLLMDGPRRFYLHSNGKRVFEGVSRP